MVRHLIFKLLSAAITVVGAAALLLSLTMLIPGDPATVLLGSRATPETVAALNAQMGLNLPLPERLIQFLAHALTGNMGKDVLSGRSVSLMLLEALPNTALLAFTSIFLAILVGFPLGAVSALHPRGFLDQVIAFISVGFVSAPSFVSSIFLLLMFALWLNWFPVLGAGDVGDPLDQLWHVVLPAVALAVTWVGYIARLLRSSLLEVLNEPYVRTMRAYGVPEIVVVMKYALKPACIPTLAILGMGVGELLGGAVFAEVIFNRPGLGSLIYGAIELRNYPVVQGGVVVIVLLFVLTNLLVDLSYAWIDPRVRAKLASKAETAE